MKNLLIVGNGFDKFFGLNTSFNEFAEWLKNKEVDKYDELKDYWNFYNYSDWNYIELGIIDKYKLYKKDDLDVLLPEDTKEINEEIKKFKNEFSIYLKEVVIPKINKSEINGEQIKICKILLEKVNIIVSYNYTRTIENLFDYENVIQLHGVIAYEKSCDNICIGFDMFSNKIDDAKNPKSSLKQVDDVTRIKRGVVVQETMKEQYYINKATQLETFSEVEGFELFQKQINNIRNFNVTPLMMEEYDNIIIFGHALGDSDNIFVEKLNLYNGNIHIIDFWVADDEDKKELFEERLNGKEFKIYNSKNLEEIQSLIEKI